MSRFKNILVNTIHHSGVTYPVPINLTYWWNFGVLALICLVVQLLTGIFLAMHYVPNAELAFSSVEHIMRDINNGWFIRYMHANGASMFFLVVYVHLFRGLYYGSYSYPRQLVWCTGVVILLIMILTAFMGYVLPWGQMSFWAATVITNLVSAVPYVGGDILNWLWGGYAVDNATLNRFFSFHYLFPFILTGLVGVHIIYLHENGSNNALGVIFNADKVPFTPYFTIKDIFGIVIFFILFSYFIFFDPVYLGHPDNFIPANPLVTPAHIVPEWYFLPFYAILRSVPNKLFGVLLLLGSILVLLVFPFLIKTNINTGFLRPLYQKFFWLFFFDSILLGWIGGKAIEEPFYTLGQLFTIFYFVYFLLILPILALFEESLYKKNIMYRELKKKNKYNTIERNSVLFINNNLFFKTLFLLIAFLQGMFLFMEGDRIPNFSIIIVMFIGYSVLVNQNVFQSTYNAFLASWLKIIENNRNVLINFNHTIMVKKIISLTFPYYFNIIKKSIITVDLLSKKIYFRNYIWNIFLFFHLIGNNFFISNMYIEKNKIINNYKIVKNFITYNTCNTLYQINTKK
jgi:quinol-cytochrome oxidoreductase complex cytochrome b subunit